MYVTQKQKARNHNENHFIQFDISPSFKKVAKNGPFCKHIHLLGLQHENVQVLFKI